MIVVVYGSYRYLTVDELERYPRYKYVTTSESKYISEDGKTVVVPKGFLTDGNSCGPSTGRSWLIHDWLYSTHQYTSGEICSRREADDAMKKILGHEGLKVYKFIFTVVVALNPCCLLSSAWESSGERGAMFIEDDE